MQVGATGVAEDTRVAVRLLEAGGVSDPAPPPTTQGSGAGFEVRGEGAVSLFAFSKQALRPKQQAEAASLDERALPTFPPTYLPTCLLTYLPFDLPTYPLDRGVSVPLYLFTCIRTYLPTFPPTSLLIYLPTYLPTC